MAFRRPNQHKWCTPLAKRDQLAGHVVNRGDENSANPLRLEESDIFTFSLEAFVGVRYEYKSIVY